MAISADLGEVLEAAVNDLVARGRYNSKSEVLREGVRLVQEREARLARLQAELEAGLADVKAGRYFDAEDVFNELIAKYGDETEEEDDVSGHIVGKRKTGSR